MVVAEPRLKMSKSSGQLLVGLTTEGLLLRGDYSPRSVLSTELPVKKNEKQKITLELSEKFITIWTLRMNGQPVSTEGGKVFIYRRADQQIWHGVGTSEDVHVDGRNYAKSEKDYSRISDEMVSHMGSLFSTYPENGAILQVISEVSGNPTNSVERFIKLLFQFLD